MTVKERQKEIQAVIIGVLINGINQQLSDALSVLRHSSTMWAFRNVFHEPVLTLR